MPVPGVNVTVSVCVAFGAIENVESETANTGEVLTDPHLRARDMIVDVEYPTRGTYQTVGCPVKLSDSPAEVTRPPLLGEHTPEVLAALCGVNADEVRKLRARGVV